MCLLMSIITKMYIDDWDDIIMPTRISFVFPALGILLGS